MKMYLSLFALLALAGCGEKAEEKSGSAQTAAAAAPETAESRGRKAFNECAVCHSVREGDSHRVGPNLYAVVGTPAGAREGFAYSKAMKESGVVWDDQALDAFMKNPRDFIPKNRMAYVGQRDDAKRADIIAYLKTMQ
ncbi:c-type cytochrome [Hyphococcus sp. DH-69]|uniref:c-type cytochrome n=1 Tax=Hyphococcus formosus TaxID=3143534 RepID=UPI00398B8F47